MMEFVSDPSMKTSTSEGGFSPPFQTLLTLFKDMTAFIARNATETMSFVSTQADVALTNWTVTLANEYVSLPVGVFELGPYVDFLLVVPCRRD